MKGSACKLINKPFHKPLFATVICLVYLMLSMYMFEALTVAETCSQYPPPCTLEVSLAARHAFGRHFLSFCEAATVVS